jgi:hypothetical protein
MPANIAINFNTSSSESTASLVDASFASQDSMALAKNFAGGNGDHQIDLIYEKRGSAAASPEAVDLSMVSDQNGNLAAFATLKGLIICNKGAATALDAIAIPAGGALVLLLPIGVDITADSNDIISIGSALGTEYEMRLIGVNVDEAE